MSHTNKSLKGKSVFILGGSGLIGREVSLNFSKLGAKVLVLDNDEKKSMKICKDMKKYNKNSNYVFFDCSDMESLENKFTEILSAYSVPQIFINCSYPKTKDWSEASFKNITFDSYRKNVDIHLNSYSWTAKLVADEMSKQSIKGSIILTSSIYGIRTQDMSIYKGTNLKENFAYPPIKAAIIHLSKQMAAYYGQFGIRVNTVCPGGIEGPISGKDIHQDSTFVERYIKKTPLGRMTKPEDVSNLMAFLASDISSYITGQAIVIDGGITLN